MADTPTPKGETWFRWMEWAPDDDGTWRLLVPCGDPHVYEYPFDLLYETPEKAITGKTEWLEPFGPEGDDDTELMKQAEGWVLVKETLEIVNGV